MAYQAPYQQAGKSVVLTVYPGPPTAFQPSGLPGQHTLVLPVNPDTQYALPYRTTPTQTVQGVYTDDFNEGVAMLALSGHTGWLVGAGQFQGQPVDGFTAMQALDLDILTYYFALESAQATQAPDVTLLYVNNIDQEVLALKPTGTLQKTRHHSKPFLYQYSVSFIVLADLHRGGLPTAPLPDPLDPVLGLNPVPNAGVPATVRPVAQAPAQAALPPPPRRVVVHSGDTLWSLVAPFVGTPVTNTKIAAEVQRVAAYNHLADPNRIYPGQVIAIPA